MSEEGGGEASRPSPALAPKNSPHHTAGPSLHLLTEEGTSRLEVQVPPSCPQAHHPWMGGGGSGWFCSPLKLKGAPPLSRLLLEFSTSHCSTIVFCCHCFTVSKLISLEGLGISYQEVFFPSHAEVTGNSFEIFF